MWPSSTPLPGYINRWRDTCFLEIYYMYMVLWPQRPLYGLARRSHKDPLCGLPFLGSETPLWVGLYGPKVPNHWITLISEDDRCAHWPYDPRDPLVGWTFMGRSSFVNNFYVIWFVRDLIWVTCFGFVGEPCMDYMFWICRRPFRVHLHLHLFC